MAFPPNLLAENEELVLDLRPHWIALAAPTAVAVGVFVAWIFIFNFFDADGAGSISAKISTGIRWVALAAGFVVLLGYTLRKVIAWITDNFVVTSDRLIHRDGFIAKRSMEIPLEAINDVRFQQTIIQRMIGAGTLIIQSASQQGREQFSNIRNPDDVQKTIYEAGEKNQHRMFGGTQGGPRGGEGSVEARADSAADEIRKLNSLRAEGVLSDEEFEAQKRKLLGT